MPGDCCRCPGRRAGRRRSRARRATRRGPRRRPGASRPCGRGSSRGSPGTARRDVRPRQRDRQPQVGATARGRRSSGSGRRTGASHVVDAAGSDAATRPPGGHRRASLAARQRQARRRPVGHGHRSRHADDAPIEPTPEPVDARRAVAPAQPPRRLRERLDPGPPRRGHPARRRAGASTASSTSRTRAVGVVAIDGEDRVVLVGQHRYTLDRVLVGDPRGWRPVRRGPARRAPGASSARRPAARPRRGSRSAPSTSRTRSPTRPACSTSRPA